jgi:Tfp pilus assembly protein PilO
MKRVSIRMLDLVCLAGLLTLLAGAAAVAVPALKARADRLRREKQAVGVRFAELRRAQAVLDRLAAVLRENHAAFETMMKRLPERVEVGDIIADLDALARISRVAVARITPGQPVPDEIGTRTPITFSCLGTFAELHAFLYNLENADHLLRVERLAMTKDAASGGCSLDVSCSVYARQ